MVIKISKKQHYNIGLRSHKKERIPLAIIYKEDGFINIDFTRDVDKSYEIFGFFKCLINKMEKELTNSLEGKKL